MDIKITIGIIVISGLVGGLANYYRTTLDKEFHWFNLKKSLILGLVASAVIPLFLQMISSDLLDKPDGASVPAFNYFVFSGFCMIAAVYSTSFLDSINKKVLERLDQVEEKTNETEQKAKEMQEKADDTIAKVNVIVDHNTATDADEEPEIITRGLPQIDLPPIFVALKKNKLPFIDLKTLVQEAGITDGDALAELKQNEKKGFIKEFKKEDGTSIFALTAKGKGMINRL